MFAEATFLSLLNRLLETQPGARARLAGHAGKTARIELPLGGLAFSLAESGVLSPAAADVAPDTTIRLSADVLMRLLLGDRDALKQAGVHGDGLFAADISAALDGFDWALALRPVVGDIAAARADQAIAGFGAWRQKAHEAIGRSLAEYGVHEANMIASRPAVDRFVAEVDTLRDDVARLEARLALLEARRAR
jgi:ubiquinone biosynthesis accessory factor UbiJ